MSGIDKIIAQIERDTKAVCDEILANANSKADVILKEAEREVAFVQKSTSEKIAVRLRDISDRADSAASLERKKCKLITKQNTISEMLTKAQQNAAALDDDSYFDLIEKMVLKNKQPQEGLIRFNASDLDRLPIDFEKRINRSAEGKLTVSSEPISIDAGFILVYGGIEENCSFDAIMRSQEEELSDKASALLFREG